MPAQRVNWFQREPGGSTTYVAPKFRTSSYCNNNGCVAVVRMVDGGVVVRSTRNPHVSVTLDAREWSVFLGGVRAGEFDQM